MNDLSFINKLSILNDIILSSPLFVCFITFLEISLVIYLIFKRKKIKFNKWVVIGIWIFIILFLIIFYNKFFIHFIDNFINYIFTALYFPNLAVYSVILIISNILFILSLISKNMEKEYKIINILNAVLINSLLIFIIDIVNTNNIDVYEKITVFSNNKLLVLLELSTGIFTSWLLLNLFFNLKKKLSKYDKKEYPDIPDIIFN